MARKEINNYFSHDANARNDEKLLRLRMKHGAAGYGVYFMILERLRGESGYRSVRDYNAIAYDFRVDASLVKSVVEDFGLFVIAEDGKGFYSESFLRRMEYKDAVREKKRDAAYARWGNEVKEESGSKVQPFKKSGKSVKKSGNKKKASLPPQDDSPARKEKTEAIPSQSESEHLQQKVYSASIDEEVEEMKKESEWKKQTCTKYKLDGHGLDVYLSDFALDCDKQHGSMQDARSHFCRWLKRKLESRISSPPRNDASANGSRPARDSRRPETSHIAKLDQQVELQRREFEERQKKRIKPADYIRSKGYDPATVTMAQIMNPQWCAENPPTLPINDKQL